MHAEGEGTGPWLFEESPEKFRLYSPFDLCPRSVLVESDRSEGCSEEIDVNDDEAREIGGPGGCSYSLYLEGGTTWSGELPLDRKLFPCVAVLTKALVTCTNYQSHHFSSIASPSIFQRLLDQHFCDVK